MQDELPYKGWVTENSMSGAKMTSAARFPKRSTPSPKKGVQRAEMIYGSDMTRPA